MFLEEARKMFTIPAPLSDPVLLSGFMVPISTGVLWALYKYCSWTDFLAWTLDKYHSWTIHRSSVDMNILRDLHKSVLFNSVHGKPESVMLVYKAHAPLRSHMCSLLFYPDQDLFLAEVVTQIRPQTSLTLGTQFGYSAIRLLSLLPSSSKLYAVEQDKNVAELVEELILMSGFKHTQFHLLTRHPTDAILALINDFGFMKIDLILMDHQPFHYLENLRIMEETGVLHSGTIILANHINDATAKKFMKHIESDKHYRIISTFKDLLKIEFVGPCLS
ncbi:transmembrane O-methyltransferase homolog [Bombina bombina]|uniref:transmembrane O-methyltransferase homolog n=1 Tax=Bombina bombina TaxID=8345 RepID=UPI00235B309F|nr:transmembrane O-methyltransferase homolog [Bombina bombina]